MAATIKYLSDFLERLQEEGPTTQFTWLVGAGLSVTSKIPLAEGTSKRIILFEYIVKNNIRLWDLESTKRVNYTNGLMKFLEWYDDEENKIDQTLLDTLLVDSIKWIKTYKPEFKDITFSSPECYQLLFKHLFQSTVLHHNFLTGLVSRAKGINLAHLCLAGLLKDYGKEWGLTVFTTNFDDLLLKSLLTINYTGRIFGDISAVIQPEPPSLKPDYPQIVYLHGRHTGYRLLNTQERIKVVDPYFQESFKSHIAHSDLIVIGYSGWDDVAMNTLEQWINNPRLIHGNLYWIPWKSEDTILPETRALLDKFPSDKTFIIVNEERNLNADSFMLALCDTINDNGGFASYRREVIELARDQHSFLLKQLKEHPDYDPEEALKHLTKAKEYVKNGSTKLAKSQLATAKSLVNSEDLPNELLAQAYLEMGIINMNMGSLTDSEMHLKIALRIWDEIKAADDENRKGMLKKADTFRALGELYLKKGNLGDAEVNLRQSLARYDKVKNDSTLGKEYANILIAMIALREGKNSKSISFLKASKAKFDLIDDHYGLYLFNKLSGDSYVIHSNLSEAVSSYNKAIFYAEILKNNFYISEVKFSLITVNLMNDNLDEASKLLYEVQMDESNPASRLREINIQSAQGDLCFKRHQFEEAIKYYQLALEKARDVNALHSMTNALADLLKTYTFINVKNEFQQKYLEELVLLVSENNNSYATLILNNYQMQNSK